MFGRTIISHIQNNHRNKMHSTHNRLQSHSIDPLLPEESGEVLLVFKLDLVSPSQLSVVIFSFTNIKQLKLKLSVFCSKKKHKTTLNKQWTIWTVKFYKKTRTYTHLKDITQNNLVQQNSAEVHKVPLLQSSQILENGFQLRRKHWSFEPDTRIQQ